MTAVYKVTKSLMVMDFLVTNRQKESEINTVVRNKRLMNLKSSKSIKSFLDKAKNQISLVILHLTRPIAISCVLTLKN